MYPFNIPIMVCRVRILIILYKENRKEHDIVIILTDDSMDNDDFLDFCTF